MADQILFMQDAPQQGCRCRGEALPTTTGNMQYTVGGGGAPATMTVTVEADVLAEMSRRASLGEVRVRAFVQLAFMYDVMCSMGIDRVWYENQQSELWVPIGAEQVGVAACPGQILHFQFRANNIEEILVNAAQALGEKHGSREILCVASNIHLLALGAAVQFRVAVTKKCIVGDVAITGPLHDLETHGTPVLSGREGRVEAPSFRPVESGKGPTPGEPVPTPSSRPPKEK